MDSYSNNCPLCGSESKVIVSDLRVSDVVELYHRMNVAVADMFGDIDMLSIHLCCDCGLEFFRPMIAGDSSLYEQLQKANDNYYQTTKPEYHFARDFVGSSHHVLEVGCGTGAFKEFISPKSYVGLEMNRAVAESIDPEKKIINEPLGRHAVRKEGFYDIVCMFQVLEHVPETRQFLKQSVACLKPGGMLIVRHDTSSAQHGQIQHILLKRRPGIHKHVIGR